MRGGTLPGWTVHSVPLQTLWPGEAGLPGEDRPSSETVRTQIGLALFLNSRLLKELALEEKVERGLGTHLTATEADFPGYLSRGDTRHAASQLLKIHSKCKKPSEKHNILIDEINTPVHAR